MALAVGSCGTSVLQEVIMLLKSWQTTGTGVCVIVLAVFNVVKAIIDGDASTNPDWDMTIAGLMAGIGLIFARDNDKTSEMVGAGAAGK